MNTCNRLIPVCGRLAGARFSLVPTRNIFSRRALVPWNMLERQMEDMDRQFNRLEREMNSAFRDFGFPRIARLVQPNQTFLTNPMFPSIEAEVSPSAEAGQPGKYSVRINVGEGFNPENIKVNLKDRTLTVQAKLEKTSEEGRIYQEFSRSFTLPENVNLEEVKSLLTPEGVLTIEAPLPELEAPSPKEIPISIEGKST